MKLEIQEEQDTEQKFVVDTKGSRRTQPLLVDPVKENGKLGSFTKPIPKSDILSRLEDFLPKIRESNKILSESKPEDLDIENVQEGTKYIQMDLGLGVFDVKDPNSKAEEITELVFPSSKVTDDPIVTFFGADSDSSSEDKSSDEETSLPSKHRLIEEV